MGMRFGSIRDPHSYRDATARPTKTKMDWVIEMACLLERRYRTCKDQVVTGLKRAAESPGDPYGLLGRARCNVSLGRYRDADADVATLLTLAPNNPLVLLMAGMIHHRLGRSHRNARGLGPGRLSAGAGPHPRLRRRGTARLGQAPTGDLQKRRDTNFRSVGHLDPPTVKPPRQLRPCLAKTREPPA